ncbi:MAG TPA: polysaccharide deacetylase family protein [Patescibacteria group bacterium]|nr:polysaccharide deacetylase family protein [Patescibacteria group bacterium]
MKKWLRPLSYIKRGLTSLFVCAVVLIPILSLSQWSHAFSGTQPADTRKATQLPAFIPRAVDTSSTPPNLFSQPLISVTFDDGWESVYTDAMPLLNKYGIHTTQYIIAGTYDDPGYLSDAQIRAIAQSGDEIASHTMTHPDLTTLLNNSDLTYQLQHSQQLLLQKFGSLGSNVAEDFAAPYGHTDPRTLGFIQKYYASQRNTNGDYTNGISQYDVNVAGNFDRYNIIGVTVNKDTKVSDLQALVSYAVAHDGWLVLVYHQADDSQSSKYALDSKSLAEQLKYLSSTMVRIVPVDQALQSLNQKLEY